MSTATSRLSHESAMLIGEIAKEIMTNKYVFLTSDFSVPLLET